MKYKTFMLLRNLGGFSLATLAAVGAFWGCESTQQKETPPSLTTVNPPVKPSRALSSSPVATHTSHKVVATQAPKIPAPNRAAVPLQERDREIFRLQKEPLSNGKPSGDSTKWVAIGDTFKAEFRADANSKKWSRVKIDFDSDKQWDERWDFKSDGSIKRRVAPSDDENYTVEYRLKSGDNQWLRVK